jgi:hypothetical protein
VDKIVSNFAVMYNPVDKTVDKRPLKVTCESTMKLGGPYSFPSHLSSFFSDNDQIIRC